MCVSVCLKRKGGVILFNKNRMKSIKIKALGASRLIPFFKEKDIVGKLDLPIKIFGREKKLKLGA